MKREERMRDKRSFKSCCQEGTIMYPYILVEACDDKKTNQQMAFRMELSILTA